MRDRLNDQSLFAGAASGAAAPSYSGGRAPLESADSGGARTSTADWRASSDPSLRGGNGYFTSWRSLVGGSLPASYDGGEVAVSPSVAGGFRGGGAGGRDTPPGGGGAYADASTSAGEGEDAGDVEATVALMEELW
jgi:hypothetical protein